MSHPNIADMANADPKTLREFGPAPPRSTYFPDLLFAQPRTTAVFPDWPLAPGESIVDVIFHRSGI
jgi:hypothetical protein